MFRGFTIYSLIQVTRITHQAELLFLVSIKFGYHTLLILERTYYINRLFQNCTIHGHTVYNCDLEFFLNGTSNEYTLQSVYNVNGFIGNLAELSQVFLAIYDISAQPFVYTGSENIELQITTYR